jgi:hypothetical protein
LFVVNGGNSTIGEYTTSGATVNSSLVSGLSAPFSIAVSGSDLFVVNQATSSIAECTTSGTTVNSSLVTGLNGPAEIAVEAQAAPEPSTWALLLGGVGLLASWSSRRDRGQNTPKATAAN